MSITLQTEGRRTYLTGNTYPHRDRIRAIGAHWDAERKMWWTAKREQAESLVAQINAQPAAAPSNGNGASKTPRDGLDSIVAGRGEYKGKTYYIAGRVERGRTSYDDGVRAVQTQDGAKVLLYFRDGSSQFWAPREAVKIVKSYDRPQTIRRLKAFAEEAKQARAQGNDDGIPEGRRYECEECGEYVTRGVGTCWETGCAH